MKNRILLAIIGVIASIQFVHSAAPPPEFRSAHPIWPEDAETEKNVSVGFRATFSAPKGQIVTLRVAASTLYRISLNGNFVGHGPARGPRGWFRVDEWDLTDKVMLRGENLIAIEVAGYNANSYYLLDQPSFLQAEVEVGEEVVAFTAPEKSAFTAKLLTERVQKVQRYSFQRPFSEVYRLTPGFDAWKWDAKAPLEPVKCVAHPMKDLLPRRVAYPAFTAVAPTTEVSNGKLQTGLKVEHLWKDRSLTAIGPKLAGFPEKELEEIPSLDLQSVANATTNAVARSLPLAHTISLATNSYSILDFGVNLTGFIGARVKCREKTRLYFTFDEILSNGDVDFKRLGCVNIVTYDLEPGTYDVESFEPYTLRYLKALVLNGDCEVQNIYLREYANPYVWQATFAASDERLNRLFAAGRETFRQNAVDIFMDCPSRERAGWLCDSFFTSRVAKDLCGDTLIEKNFFENFALPARFEYLPDGMLPMCYPADHNDGVFIPNWSLWFVVELEEYAQRSGDKELVEALRPRVIKLLNYFKQYRNEDGLLEKLPSWVFVEWSKANDFVQDVNYPSNMLYAKALAAAANLYEMPELAKDAEKLRNTIRQQSFDGEFFVDNAVRKDGKLQVTRNRSEVCQYFAFYFDVASPKTETNLWKVLTKDFGPQRKQTKAFPEVHPANAFIGNVLRLELLSRYGLAQQNLDESIAYLLYMAERTGTLWENDGAYASCNHGFASHIVHVLYRDVLGIREINELSKKVKLHFSDAKLEWCEGTVPTTDGLVKLRWRKDHGKLRHTITLPAGWSAQVDD